MISPDAVSEWRKRLSRPEPIQSTIPNAVQPQPADLQVDAKRFQFKEGGDETASPTGSKALRNGIRSNPHGAGLGR